MENIEAPIQKEESTAVIKETTTTETTPVVNGEQTTPETTPVVNGEPTTEVTPVTESTENTEEIVPPTDEQENVTDTNTSVPSTSMSPGRANVPLKEVNESGKEEPAVIPNGTENGMSKKRELEQEDEPTEETTNDNDERTAVDQSKKLKISEATDTPIIEAKEVEKNIVVNGNTAVEV